MVAKHQSTPKRLTPCGSEKSVMLVFSDVNTNDKVFIRTTDLLPELTKPRMPGNFIHRITSWWLIKGLLKCKIMLPGGYFFIYAKIPFFYSAWRNSFFNDINI
jgi:hypothetical protein